MSDILSILGRSHTKEILAYLGARDEVRFSEIEGALDLNPATVDRRLKELVEVDLVEANRRGYSLTPDGRDVLVTLAVVSEEWPAESVAPDQEALMNVGTMVQSIRNLRRARDSPLHILLDALPLDIPEGDPDEPDVERITQHLSAVTPTYLRLARQYDLIRIEDAVAHPTRLGTAVLALIEEVPP